MAIARNNTASLLLLVLLAVGALVLFPGALIGGLDHANTRHSTAIAARASIRQGMCQSFEAWYDPKTGRMLLICDLGGEQCAGWVLYVTENGGSRLLPGLHEATAFVDSCRYWRNSAVRDNMVPIVQFPAVAAHVARLLGIPVP